MSSLPKTFKLNNGQEMPVIGLGTFLSKNASIMTNLIRDALGNLIFFRMRLWAQKVRRWAYILR